MSGFMIKAVPVSAREDFSRNLDLMLDDVPWARGYAEPLGESGEAGMLYRGLDLSGFLALVRRLITVTLNFDLMVAGSDYGGWGFRRRYGSFMVKGMPKADCVDLDTDFREIVTEADLSGSSKTASHVNSNRGYPFLQYSGMIVYEFTRLLDVFQGRTDYYLRVGGNGKVRRGDWGLPVMQLYQDYCVYGACAGARQLMEEASGVATEIRGKPANGRWCVIRGAPKLEDCLKSGGFRVTRVNGEEYGRIKTR